MNWHTEQQAEREAERKLRARTMDQAHHLVSAVVGQFMETGQSSSVRDLVKRTGWSPSKIGRVVRAHDHLAIHGIEPRRGWRSRKNTYRPSRGLLRAIMRRMGADLAGAEGHDLDAVARYTEAAVADPVTS